MHPRTDLTSAAIKTHTLTWSTSNFSVDPNPTGHPYTIPAITLPDGTWIQDSHKIAKAIEERYPDRPLNLESPYQARIQALVPKAIVPIMAIGLNQIPRRLLNKPSYDYWMVDRAPRVGGDFAGNEAENGGEVAYTASAPGIKEITAMLKENADGPFFGGKDVSYADFVWIGALEFLRRIGDDVLEGALSHSGDRTVHENLLEAAEPWLARNNY